LEAAGKASARSDSRAGSPHEGDRLVQRVLRKTLYMEFKILTAKSSKDIKRPVRVRQARYGSSRDCATLLETTAAVANEQAAGKLLTLPADPSAERTRELPRLHQLTQRLSNETVAALASDYRHGCSLAELQRRYSLSRSSVQKLLRERGVRRRRKSLTVGPRCG
jgi:DNA-directed RNA polymerase specialized sigma24 family protein